MRRFFSFAVFPVVGFISSFRSCLIIFSTILMLASSGMSQMPTPSPVQLPTTAPGTYNPALIGRDDYEVYPSKNPISPFYWIKSNDDTEGYITVESQSGSFGSMVHANCGFAGCADRGVLGYTPDENSTGLGADVGYYYTSYFHHSNLARVTIVATAQDDAENAGESCPVVAEPVNVTNGNMWLKQIDFALPGRGKPIEVRRFYNSIIQTSGIFGRGWSTVFDESLQIHNGNLARLNMPDGRAVYFVRETSNGLFMPHTAGMQAFIEENTGGTFTLTFKDGIKHQFNAGGRLTSITDRNGNQTTLNYTSNILTGITDASGRTLTINMSGGLVQSIGYDNETIASYTYYNGTTNLQTVDYQDGSQYKFEYDTTTVAGKTFLKTVKDANNKILETHEYDAQGRATTSEKEGGVEKYIFDYSNWNLTFPSSPYTLVQHKKQASDASFIDTKYYFNKTMTKNFVWKTEGGCNCGSGAEVTTFEYDNRLNLKKKSEQISTYLWRETTFTYNYQGDVLTQNEKVGSTDLGTEKFTYNPFGQVLTYQDKINSATVPPTNTIVNEYDANGNLTTTTDALGNITTITYPTTNNKGLPDSVKDARLNETKLKWFSSGLLEEIEDANNKKTNFTYDARGRTKTVTNALLHTTTYNYFDDTQRKVEMIYPNTDKITYKYDIRRLLESVTDERGKITTYTFDTAYRLTKITDALGHTRETGYDLMSNVIWSKDGLGNQTDYVYDDFNRLKEIIYPAASTGETRLKEKFEYDMVGRIKKIIDTANRETVYNYDDAQRKTSVTNAETETTQTKYNARMQAVEVKDALNQVYTFTYNPFGQVLTQTRAGGTMSYEYDEAGNTKKRTDYLGRVTNYTYDDINRLTDINYDGSTNFANYVYDDVSRLTDATNQVGTVSFDYDNRNRVKSTTDVFNHEIEYTYGDKINRTGMKLDGQTHTSYVYDDANRLTDMTDEANADYTFGYDAANRLKSRVLPNGVETTYNYDDINRLKQLKHENSTTTLFDNQYLYNPAQQISRITELAQTRNFSYDDTDRLTNVANPTSSVENFSYDAVGNRALSHQSSFYTYDPFNRLKDTDTFTYQTDANGNRISKTTYQDPYGSIGTVVETTDYEWDEENRLIAVNVPDFGIVSYQYDALGRRVKKIDGEKGETAFTYDGLDVVMDNDTAAGVTTYQNAPGIDNKLKMKSWGVSQYFLADHLGSTVGLTNGSGALTDSTSYDSFGNATNADFPTRYQFTGREFDKRIGLHYYRARWYDAQIGRFISEDPIGFAGGDVNLFGYVGNNPQNWIDPTGLRVEAFYNQTPTSYGSYTPTWRDEWLPNWLGYNTGSNDGVWWNCLFNKWNDLRDEGPVIFGTYGGGDFSVIDWEGYPDADPPDGPFRILDGVEQENARRLADNENRRLHRNDRSQYDGKQIHERQPVNFGGSPTDPNNKMALTPQRHRDYNRFWARLKASIKR